MSIFSQLKAGKITFSQAAEQFLAWAAKVPVLSLAVGDLKQAASDTVAAARTGLDYGLDQAISEAEAMIDKFVGGATGGSGAVTRPLEQAALRTAADILKAVIDAAVLKAIGAPDPSTPPS